MTGKRKLKITLQKVKIFYIRFVCDCRSKRKGERESTRNAVDVIAVIFCIGK